MFREINHYFISVICSDKTGTLTTNNMMVTDFGLFGGNDKWKQYEVNALVRDNSEMIHNVSSFLELLNVAAICNDAQIESSSYHDPKEKKFANADDGMKIKGDASGLFLF